MAVVAPAVPATGVVATNTTGQFVDVAISANGATITNVSIVDQTGVSHTMLTAAGSVLLPPGYGISIAYTVATPTWVWTDPEYSSEILQFGGYAASNLVLISQLSQQEFPAHSEVGQPGLGEAVSN